MDIQTANQLYPNKNREDSSEDPIFEERDPKLSSLIQGFLSQTEITPTSSFDELVALNECRWTQEQFIPISSEPLPSKQDKLFSEHLRRCPSCDQEFKQFQQFKKSFSWPEVEPTRPIDQFWQKVRCREFQDDLLSYSKQELPEARSQEIQKHLTDCPSCSRHLTDIQNNLILVSSVLLKEIEPAPQAWEKLKQEMERPLSKPSLSRWRLASSVIFMALGCLLLFSLVWQQRSISEPRLLSGLINTEHTNNAIHYQSLLSTENCLAQLEMNGVRLLVNKNASFKIDSPYHIQLLRGEMLVEVPPGLGYNLTVTTPNATAFVIGTKFNIHTTEQQTDLAVFQGKVLFGPPQKTTQAIRGTEASVTDQNHLNIKQVCKAEDSKGIQLLEEQLLKRYHKNALTLSLEKQSPQKVRACFKNHGTLPLKIVPIRANSSAHSWSVTSAYGQLQYLASPNLCLETKPSNTILLKPGQAHILDYDVSPYLRASGDYELSLNYVFNDPREDSFWTGHLTSNSISIHHP